MAGRVGRSRKCAPIYPTEAAEIAGGMVERGAFESYVGVESGTSKRVVATLLAAKSTARHAEGRLK